MQTLIEKAKLDAEYYLSWAAYHASQQPETNTTTSTIALLPLFRDNAHTTCMIKHAMDVISKAVKHLNPTQIPVIVADQPLYAIAKQIQWCYPETHGENRIVVMMGGLHIEMNLLKLLGDWLPESWWTTALLRPELTTSGRADVKLSGAHVTRNRYAHQVTAATLCMLQKRAHEQYLVRSGSGVSFEEWCTLPCEQQPQFKYWTITFHMQLLLLQFLRSIRERSFSMYIQCLLQIAPWCFALDHTNYARWLPVHISDMVNLIRTHPDVHSQFSSGHFVVQKTTNLFSAMAIDQCHEQVNAPIKSDGGAVGLTESPQALERWMVAGPEIVRVLLEFEASFSTPSDTTTGKHHEQKRSTQLTFAKDVISLSATFEDMGNPFLEDSGDMLTLDTKIVMTKDATRTVNAVEQIGQRQFSEVVEDRLKSASNKPLSDIVSNNKLALFSTHQAKQRSRSKEQVASLKINCTLFSRLYIACQARQSNLDSFFEHENQACPPSIYDTGQLRQGSKSDLMECLTKSSQL